MVTMIPCLGHPSRAAAVRALHIRGLSISKICNQTGMTAKDVTSVIARFERDLAMPPARVRKGLAPSILDHLNAETVKAFRPAAIRRGLTVEALIHECIEIMGAEPSLVDAILDDMPAKVAA